MQIDALVQSEGPIENLLQKVSFFQKLEKKQTEDDSNYKRILSTAIITARNAQVHERVVATLKSQNVEADDVSFDDQIIHLDHLNIPAVHIPFEIANK